MEARSRTHTVVLEFLATFGLVYFAAGVWCVNQLTTPANENPGLSHLTPHQPGILGMALVYGLVYGVFLNITLPRRGGGLNPAITLMLWVFARIDSGRVLWLIVAQLLGAFLAGLCLRWSFDAAILEQVRYGTPHLNPLAYPELQQPTLVAGTFLELLLTFFLVLAIFLAPSDGPWAGFCAGAVLMAGMLMLFPLTGAAANPARWFGPFCWEAMTLDVVRGQPGPWTDMVVYVAGPILGSLLAGLACFRWIPPMPQPAAEETKK